MGTVLCFFTFHSYFISLSKDWLERMHTEKTFVEDDIICKDLCFSLCDVHIRFPTCSIMSFLLLCLTILKTKCCPCKVRLAALKIDAFQLFTGMDSLAQ